MLYEPPPTSGNGPPEIIGRLVSCVCNQICDHGLPGIGRRTLVELRSDQARDKLRGLPVVPGGAMTVDLHGDAIVRVADAVADDLGTDIVVSVAQPRGQKPRCRQRPWWQAGTPAIASEPQTGEEVVTK
jgi:hypothetical protein